MQTSPTAMPPYTGQSQQQVIAVPRPIVFKESETEEGCWVMPPYANLFPGGEQPPTSEPRVLRQGTAFVPPPIQTTDLWSAQQTWPM